MVAAAAEARAVLLEMVSEHLDEPVGDLEVRKGVIHARSDPGKHVSYGELAKGRRLELPDMAAAVLVRIEAEYSYDEKEVNQETIFEYLLGAPSSAREVVS